MKVYFHCGIVQQVSERKLLSGIRFQVQRNPADPVTRPIVVSECDWVPSGRRRKPLACGQKAGVLCPLHRPSYLMTTSSKESLLAI